MIRTGTLYTEFQRNLGKGGRGGELQGYRYVKGVGRVTGGRLRWVAEISYHNKRYRFRSTNYGNVRQWLDAMLKRFNDD